MTGAGRVAQKSLVWPSIVALLAFSAFIGLGTWQIERKAWKDGLIAALNERLAADPQALPAPARWRDLDPANDEYRRVRFTATFSVGEALVYAGGSTFRPDVSGPGYWVFAPTALAEGALVVVNRGFVPEGRQDPATHPLPNGPIELVGSLRWPEPRGLLSAKDDPARNQFFVRDQLAIAAAKGWGAVAPFYVELETPTGANNLPRAGRLTPSLRNEHLQYALTWYGLATVLVVAFAFWIRSRRREASRQS